MARPIEVTAVNASQASVALRPDLPCGCNDVLDQQYNHPRNASSWPPQGRNRRPHYRASRCYVPGCCIQLRCILLINEQKFSAWNNSQDGDDRRCQSTRQKKKSLQGSCSAIKKEAPRVSWVISLSEMYLVFRTPALFVFFYLAWQSIDDSMPLFVGARVRV